MEGFSHNNPNAFRRQIEDPAQHRPFTVQSGRFSYRIDQRSTKGSANLNSVASFLSYGEFNPRVSCSFWAESNFVMHIQAEATNSSMEITLSRTKFTQSKLSSESNVTVLVINISSTAANCVNLHKTRLLGTETILFSTCGSHQRQCRWS